jgi:hypothetical protein
MRTLIRSHPVIGLLTFLCIELVCRLCSAQVPLQCLYPSSLYKKNPVAFIALRKIIPSQFHKNDWIYKLEGVQDEMTSVSVGPSTGEAWYLYGSVCKPHDCAANNFAFLVDYKGSRAVGLLVSEAEAPGKTLAMGSPSAIELTLLRAKISQW